jgi:hypothetical protein
MKRSGKAPEKRPFLGCKKEVAMTMRPYSRRAAKRALGLSGIVARRFPRVDSEVDGTGQEPTERRRLDLGLADPLPGRTPSSFMSPDGYR